MKQRNQIQKKQIYIAARVGVSLIAMLSLSSCGGTVKTVRDEHPIRVNERVTEKEFAREVSGVRITDFTLQPDAGKIKVAASTSYKTQLRRMREWDMQFRDKSKYSAGVGDCAFQIVSPINLLGGIVGGDLCGSSHDLAARLEHHEEPTGQVVEGQATEVYSGTVFLIDNDKPVLQMNAVAGSVTFDVLTLDENIKELKIRIENRGKVDEKLINIEKARSDILLAQGVSIAK